MCMHVMSILEQYLNGILTTFTCPELMETRDKCLRSCKHVELRWMKVLVIFFLHLHVFIIIVQSSLRLLLFIWTSSAVQLRLITKAKFVLSDEVYPPPPS